MTQDEVDEMLRRLQANAERLIAIQYTQKQQLADHEERLRYAEETLRQVMITQQGIKDILDRLNGR